MIVNATFVLAVKTPWNKLHNHDNDQNKYQSISEAVKDSRWNIAAIWRTTR